MIITNIDNVPGKKVKKVLGIVQGNVMGTKALGEPLLGTIKKALTSALSLGPKIITGEDVGLVPKEEMKEKTKEAKTQVPDPALEEYSELLFQLREKALANMIKNAEKKSADAIINVHFGVNVILMHAFEVYAYGTAVKLG